jgi:hypothetical protein
VSYVPSIRRTRAPYVTSWATLAGGAVFGTNSTVEAPVDAPMHASDAPAFPVEAPQMTDAPSSRARARTTELARSFSEPDGLRPSSLR